MTDHGIRVRLSGSGQLGTLIWVQSASLSREECDVLEQELVWYVRQYPATLQHCTTVGDTCRALERAAVGLIAAGVVRKRLEESDDVGYQST